MPAVSRCQISYPAFDLGLCLLLVLNYEGSVSSQELLTVNILPPSEFFEENKPATLVCLVTAALSGDFPLSWSRDGGLPAFSGINNTRIGSDTGVTYKTTLTFVPGALDNQVPIICGARVGSSSGSASYKPSIILLPDEPIIVAPNRSDVSGKLTWTCQSSGASQSGPNVYWRDGNGSALTSGVSRSTMVEQKPHENLVYSITLTITREAKDFLTIGSLVCVVVHSLAEYYSVRSTSQILDLPGVYNNGSDVLYVTEAARLILPCVVTGGNPPATQITWTKDGQLVTLTSPERYEKVSTTSASLVILSVVKQDMGDYLCSATSLLGSTGITSPITLIVRYRPQITSLTNDTKLTAPTGGSIILQCPVDCFPSATSLQWSRVIHERTFPLNMSSSSRYSGGSVTNQQYDLSITSLLLSDAGVYVCEASNEVGKGSSPNITLIVTSPSLLLQQASVSNPTTVAFGVISLILLITIIIIIAATCYLCKFSRAHERARVGPVMDPAVKNSGRLCLPPLNPGSEATSPSVDDPAPMTIPITLLPAARPGDDRADRGSNGILPENLETPLFRLPPLDPDNRSYDTPFRWSAHLQSNSQAPNGSVFKVSNGAVISSLDQTSVLLEKISMMK